MKRPPFQMRPARGATLRCDGKFVVGGRASHVALASEEDRRMGRGQMAIAQETMEEYYKPLRDAIEAVRAEAAA